MMLRQLTDDFPTQRPPLPLPVDAKTIFPTLNSQNYIEFQDNIKVMATF
jgi:hypothetical protein